MKKRMKLIRAVARAPAMLYSSAFMCSLTKTYLNINLNTVYMKASQIASLCFVALAIAACKKERPDQIAQGAIKPNATMRKIEQKLMDVSPEKVFSMVNALKAGADGHNVQENVRLVTADSINLDSSLFVIEAALNYDFDVAIDSSYESGSDSVQVNISYNGQSGMISSNDLEDAYRQLASAVVAMGQANGDIRVRAIDVEAYIIDASSILLKAKVLQIMSVPKNPCMYTSPANASPYWQYYTTWYLGSNPTPVPPKPDAATILNGLLNCQRFKVCANGQGVYYINIVTITQSSINTTLPVIGTNPYNPNSSALFSTPWMTQQAMYSTFVALNPTQISTYRNGCNTLISSNTPNGKVNIHNQVAQFASYDPAPKWCVYWKLNMTYATDAGCRQIPSK